MTILDFVACIPAVVVSVWLCVWTVRHGDEPMRDGKRLFIIAALIALGLAGWSVACDILASSSVETYFIHAAANYVIAGAGVIIGLIVSIVRPQPQRG